MCERDFQINVERQLNNIIPNYNETIKFPSDTLFHFINKAKDEKDFEKEDGDANSNKKTATAVGVKFAYSM